METLVPTPGRKSMHRLRTCDGCGKSVHIKGTKAHEPNHGIFAFFELGKPTHHYCTDCAPEGNMNSPMFWRVENKLAS